MEQQEPKAAGAENQPASSGSKFLDFAKAISIIAAALLSIYSAVTANKASDSARSTRQSVDSLGVVLNTLDKRLGEDLQFDDLAAGDTLRSMTPLLKGHLIGDVHEHFNVYGVVKIGDAYSVIPGAIAFEANGSWEHQFVIGVHGPIKVGLIVCNQEASSQLEKQIALKDYRLDLSKYPGVKVVKTIPVYVQ